MIVKPLNASDLTAVPLPKHFVKELESGGIRVITLQDEEDGVCADFWTYGWCRRCGRSLPRYLVWITHTRPTE
jgi:hypothetical protein